MTMINTKLTDLEQRCELIQIATQFAVALLPYQMMYEWSPEDLVEMAVDDALRLIAEVEARDFQ